MIDDQVRSVLMQPVIVRLTTIQPNGYPHTVPIWFILDQDEIILFTGRQTRKVKNILENPKGNISIGGDPVGSASYTVEGNIVIEDDPDHKIAAQITHHYENPEKAEEYLTSWKNDDFVILRLKPQKMIKIS